MRIIKIFLRYDFKFAKVYIYIYDLNLKHNNKF